MTDIELKAKLEREARALLTTRHDGILHHWIPESLDAMSAALVAAMTALWWEATAEAMVEAARVIDVRIPCRAATENEIERLTEFFMRQADAARAKAGQVGV